MHSVCRVCCLNQTQDNFTAVVIAHRHCMNPDCTEAPEERPELSSPTPYCRRVFHRAWRRSGGAVAQQLGLGPCLRCGGCPRRSVGPLPLPPADTLELADAAPEQQHHCIREGVGTKSRVLRFGLECRRCMKQLSAFCWMPIHLRLQMLDLTSSTTSRAAKQSPSWVWTSAWSVVSLRRCRKLREVRGVVKQGM